MKSIAWLMLAVLLPSAAIAKDKDIIKIQFVIDRGKDMISSPSISVESGRKVTVEIAREVQFPTEWDLPREETNLPETKKIISPVTPLEFQHAKSGLIIECCADRTEKGMIRVAGVVTFSDVELRQAVHGEQSGPIYSKDKSVLLSANKAKSGVVRSSSTYFQVFALPGKKISIYSRFT